jgi:hypothetical protein
MSHKNLPIHKMQQISPGDIKLYIKDASLETLKPELNDGTISKVGS